MVVDDFTGVPLRNARVVLRGLQIEARTDAAGQFLLENLPHGMLDARFEAPGYVSLVEEIELLAAEYLQVRLSPITAMLDEILVRTGRPPRMFTPPANQIRNDGASWRSVLDLLQDQVPGVVVRRRGALGAGASIYLRGVGSFRGNIAPDVFLDGVRVDSAVNPDAMHTLEQIPADVVARIRVVKGASAGASTGNANGAIYIETHRGPSVADSN
jgi:hypothetical protein